MPQQTNKYKIPNNDGVSQLPVYLAVYKKNNLGLFEPVNHLQNVHYMSSKY